MRSTFLFITIICSVFVVSCQSETTKNYKDSRLVAIDSLITFRNNAKSFDGGIVISKNDEVIFEKYIGIADRTWNISSGKDVIYDIASLNKSMIAALIMKAVEEDVLRLEDKLADLLSGYEIQGEFHQEITLHHMLCHTSGLPDYDSVDSSLAINDFLLLKRKHFSTLEYVDFISQLKPVAKPGTQFYYSNFAYHLLAIVLEEKYDSPFEEILREKLTKPLGLKNTFSISDNRSIIKKLAKGYSYQEKSGEWVQNPFIDLSIGRRVFSTPLDLNRWGQVLNKEGYLTQESLSLIKTNHLTDISDNISYGYGWVVVEQNSQSKMGNLPTDMPYIIHGGSTDGYRSMLVNINNGKFVISFLSNSGSRTQELQLASDIVTLLLK